MSLGILTNLDKCRTELLKANKSNKCNVSRLCIAEALIRYVLEGYVRGEAVKISQSLLKSAINTIFGIQIGGKCLEIVLGKIRSRLVTCSKVLIGHDTEFGDGVIVRRWDLIKLIDCLVGADA